MDLPMGQKLVKPGTSANTTKPFQALLDCVFTQINIHSSLMGRAETIHSAYDTIRYAHDSDDMIRSVIHLPFFPGKQWLVIPACDQKHCTPPTTTACPVIVHSGYNNGGLLGVSRCSLFVMNSLILLEYTDCYLWYLVCKLCSFLILACVTSVPYRIVLRAYRDTYRSLCIGDIPVCRCIVSALLMGKCHSDERKICYIHIYAMFRKIAKIIKFGWVPF